MPTIRELLNLPEPSEEPDLCSCGRVLETRTEIFDGECTSCKREKLLAMREDES